MVIIILLWFYNNDIKNCRNTPISPLLVVKNDLLHFYIPNNSIRNHKNYKSNGGYVTIWIGGKVGKTNLTGTVVGVDVTAAQKIWRSFQAVGDIAFAYAYATVLIEIQASYQ